MKRLILVSEEIDSHSSSSVVITTTQKAYEDALYGFLYDGNGEMLYSYHGEQKNSENEIVKYYTGDFGMMTITVVTFSSFKEIQNYIFYNRTG